MQLYQYETYALEGVGKWGWGGSASHPGRFTPGIRFIVQEAGWPLGSVWTGVENPVFTGFQTAGRPARSESLYRLSHSGRLL